jgi:hypothetical protein
MPFCSGTGRLLRPLYQPALCATILALSGWVEGKFVKGTTKPPQFLWDDDHAVQTPGKALSQFPRARLTPGIEASSRPRGLSVRLLALI